MAARKTNTDSSKTQEVIIHAATLLFGQKGFEGTTTRQIAALAGVNVATLNYHFHSKKNLLHAVIRNSLCTCQMKANMIYQKPQQTVLGYVTDFYESLLADGDKILAQYKVFLSDEQLPFDIQNPYPPGHHELFLLFKKEVPPEVGDDYLHWAVSILFSYLIKTAVMRLTFLGTSCFPDFFTPEKVHWSLEQFVKMIVERLHTISHPNGIGNSYLPSSELGHSAIV
jgi:AcrR family transcriptional regulator